MTLHWVLTHFPNLISMESSAVEFLFLLWWGREREFFETHSSGVVVRLGELKLVGSFCVTHLPSLDGGRKRSLGKRKMRSGNQRLSCWWFSMERFRVHIFCFWPHLQFTLLIMKCLALVKMPPHPDFYLCTCLFITHPNPQRICGSLPQEQKPYHNVKISIRIENQDQGKM